MLIEAVKATFESQTYYKPPSYHGLRTNLLKQSKVDVSKQVTQFTNMEQPFVLIIKTMLHNIHC
jgi:hypothetical protein